MHDSAPPNDRIPHPSLSPHCEHAGALPLSLRSDSWPLPPLLVPSNKKAAVALLYSPSPPPPFRAPSQRGRRRSWVGINTGSSSCRLCAPSTARSSSQPPSPTPRPPPNSDTHNCIPAFSPPLFIPMLMPQPPPTTPLTCVFRHARPRPYPLSPFQSNSNTSSVADCFREPCVNASRHAMSLCPPFLLVASLLKYITSIHSVLQFTKLAISYLCFQAPPLFFSNSFVSSQVFSMLDRNLALKNKIKVHSN